MRSLIGTAALALTCLVSLAQTQTDNHTLRS
jgi:hypothetical protein